MVSWTFDVAWKNRNTGVKMMFIFHTITSVNIQASDQRPVSLSHLVFLRK
jgi:hypothetical protein